MPDHKYDVKLTEDDVGLVYIEQGSDLIAITPDQGLRLAHKLMAICSGQYAYRTYEVPRQEPTPNA